MYFLELIVKKFKNRKNKLNSNLTGEGEKFLNPTEQTEEESCEHIFMPIDSTGEVLACKNCGLTVNRKDLKDINFFRRAK